MPLVRAACVLLLAVLPVGCGRSATNIDELSGSKVGTIAERELEAENPRLVPGRLTCPDLRFHVGASVRCVRTTTLSAGRIVKVGGTVRVTSLDSGGRLHVAMDDEATEFGLAGEQVATELRQRYAGLSHATPGAVTCPYVPGRVGARATCRIEGDSGTRSVDVVVIHADSATYEVRCAFRAHRRDG